MDPGQASHPTEAGRCLLQALQTPVLEHSQASTPIHHLLSIPVCALNALVKCVRQLLVLYSAPKAETSSTQHAAPSASEAGIDVLET